MMKAKSIAYQNSDLVSQSSELISHKSELWNWLGEIGRFLVQALKQHSELKITQVADRSGDICWKVYDPIHQRTLWFYSESEVRTWIDRRFG